MRNDNDTTTPASALQEADDQLSGKGLFARHGGMLIALGFSVALLLLILLNMN